MKCINCDKEFQGNFCPYCGTKASNNIDNEKQPQEINDNNTTAYAGGSQNNTSSENKNKTAVMENSQGINNTAQKKGDTNDDGIFSHLFDLCFSIITTVFMVKFDIGIGWIIGYWLLWLVELAGNVLLGREKGLNLIIDIIREIFTFVLLVKIDVSVGIMILYLAVTVIYDILDYKKHKLAKPAEIISLALSLLIFVQLYNIYQQYKCIDIAKNSQYLTYTYEELFALHHETECLHIHIALNTVSFIDGTKIRINLAEIKTAIRHIFAKYIPEQHICSCYSIY